MANRDSLVMEKLDWHLLPLDMLEPVVKVLMGGKKKYGAWNWMSEPHFAKHVVLNSALRHLAALQRGESQDPDSGLSHAAHLICNGIFALYYETHKLWAKSEEDEPSTSMRLPPDADPTSDEVHVDLPDGGEEEAIDVVTEVPLEADASDLGPGLTALRDAIVARFDKRLSGGVI